jgi:hypothetical protein
MDAFCCCCACHDEVPESYYQEQAAQEQRAKAAREKEEAEEKQQKIAQLKTEIWAFSHDQPLSETDEQRAERWTNIKKAVMDLSALTGEPPQYLDMSTATARPAASADMPGAFPEAGPGAGPAGFPPFLRSVSSSDVSAIYPLSLCSSRLYY